VSLSDYEGMFETVAVQEGGVWYAEVVMKAATTNSLQIQVNADVAAVVPALGESTVTVNATPGFYYSVSRVGSLPGDFAAGEGDRVLANGSTVELPMPKEPLGASAGFYKVMVNNVYASGYCESTFALTADDPTTTELKIDTDPNSVAEQADKAIVYPNPTDGRISISTTTSAQVSIYDANGQKVMHGNGRCFDLGHLAPGLYLVEVIESTGQHHVERIMKR
jgi:hypothetical protein